MTHLHAIATLLWTAFSGWDWSEIIAALLVAVGCIGEMAWVFAKAPPKEEWLRWEEFEAKKSKMERVYAVVVAIGVAMELIILPRSLSEVAQQGIELEGLRSNNIALASQLTELQTRLTEAKTELAIEQMRLQERLAETATNVASLDPSKWPVHSITADVRLTFSQVDWVGDMVFPAHLTISQGGRQRVRLSSHEAINLNVAGRYSRNSAFILPFGSPVRPLPPIGLASSAPPAIQMFSGMTAQAAGEALDTLDIEITNFPVAAASMVHGSALVCLNGRVFRKFQIDSGNIEKGAATFTGHANTNMPIVLLGPM